MVLPTPAQAWTDANVRSASASIDVASDGSALVALQLQVRVAGGWLEGLELTGLDPNLELDPNKPVWVASMEPPYRKFEPRIRRGPRGTLHLGFRGRGASPRRGTLLVGLIYRAQFVAQDHTPSDASSSVPGGGSLRATSGGRVEVAWRFPAWQSGLDRVTVALRVPGATARPVGEPGKEPDERFEWRQIVGSEHTTILWERAHLPRTMPWRVAAEVPGEIMTAAARPVAAAAGRKEHGSSKSATTRPKTWRVLALAGLLWLWLLGTGYWFRRQARRRFATPASVVPLPRALSLAAQAMLVWGATEYWATGADAGLLMLAFACALALESTPRRDEAEPREGRWRWVTRSDWDAVRRNQRHERLGFLLPHDATTPLGCGIMIAWGVFVWRFAGSDDPFLIGTLVLFWAPCLTATRLHLPSTAHERLKRLGQAARSMTEPPAMSLQLHETTDGEVQEAKLIGFEGAARREIRIGERAGLGGVRRMILSTAVAETV